MGDQLNLCSSAVREWGHSARQQTPTNCVDDLCKIIDFSNVDFEVLFSYCGDGLLSSAAKLKFQDAPNCCLQLGQAKMSIQEVVYVLSKLHSYNKLRIAWNAFQTQL